MLKNQTINLNVVEKVDTALGELNKEVVYVGGAVVSLYSTDEGAEHARPTKDIDISVQISSYSQMEALREQLAAKKIYPAIGEKLLYRYAYEGILIDFIPFEEISLGPTNSWLKPGFNEAYFTKVGNIEIKILPVSLFLATKWEAFKSRGSDQRMSHDFEDIAYVVDNNLQVVDDVAKASTGVRGFLKEMCAEILNHSARNEIIECHINPFTREVRRKIIISKLEKILEL